MSEPTKEEAAWTRKLQRVLNDCPSLRLGFYTIGDRTIVIYDKTLDSEIEAHGRDFCQGVDATDASLGELKFPSNVHSTAG